MPTSTDPESGAAATAEAEADRWLGIAADVASADLEAAVADRPPTEAEVVGFHDPRDDLRRRGREWGFDVGAGDLGTLARFAAGLAAAEADAWRADAGDVALRAYEARRFLLGDRILHWAVPWLDAAGRCHPEARQAAHRVRDELLRLGEEHRAAPRLTGTEGVYPPGEDAYGPEEVAVPLERWLDSVWSGTVLFRATVVSLSADPTASRRLTPARIEEHRGELSLLYEIAAARWRRRADEYPGSAALWLDLSIRAERTAGRLAAAG